MHTLLLALSLAGATAPAPQWPRPFLSPSLRPVPLGTGLRPTPPEARSTGRLVMGGVLGAVVGLGAGLLTYSALDRNDPCFASDCDSDLGAGLVAATAGVTIGVPAGVHLANGGKGPFWRSLLVSTAIAGAGWGGAALADDARWLLLIPPAQIVGSVLSASRP